MVVKDDVIEVLERKVRSSYRMQKIEKRLGNAESVATAAFGEYLCYGPFLFGGALLVYAWSHQGISRTVSMLVLNSIDKSRNESGRS